MKGRSDYFIREKPNRRRRRVLGQNDRENPLTSWGLRPPPVTLFQRGKENDDDVLILHSLSDSLARGDCFLTKNNLRKSSGDLDICRKYFLGTEKISGSLPSVENYFL